MAEGEGKGGKASGVRLTADEVQAIKAAAAEAFGASAVVRLFGSRVDDTKRGGDIDLLIEAYGVEVEVAFVARVRGMTRFDTVEELVVQMHDDVRRCRQLLGLPAHPAG